jgi:tRNA pseudouridine65 synthase
MIPEILTPQILEETDQYWLMYKPCGWFVHPPDDKRALKQFSQKILTSWFWQHFNQKAFPIHRLDFPTEGLMIWAKDSESAGILNELHYDNRLQKTYHAVVRGHMPEIGRIDIPLSSDMYPEAVPCLTEYKTLNRIEKAVQINSEHATSRYSLVEAYLKTGRWHQIRRHFNRIAHPIIGDREHGDSHHNRFFRDKLELTSLLLKAHRLEFICPFTNEKKKFEAPLTKKWHQVYSLFDKSISDELRNLNYF